MKKPMRNGPRMIHLALLELARNDKSKAATSNLLWMLQDAFIERAQDAQEEDMLRQEFAHTGNN